MKVKKQVVDRLLGEVSHSGDVYQNASAIAHVFVNRAKATGTSLDSVTSLKSQVNAQKPAKGSEKNRAIVEKALNDAVSGGSKDPTSGATYYATPKAFDGLPSGVKKTQTIGGHVFATDPQNRPIKTADGVKKVNPLNINTPLPAAKPAQTVPKDTASPFGVALGEKMPFSQIRDSMNFTNPAIGRKGSPPIASGSMDYQNIDSIERANSAFRQLGINPQINNSFREGAKSPPDKRPTGFDLNNDMGGASGSQHQFGNAFDISTRGMTGAEKAAMVDNLIAKGFNGIGMGANVVHADTRPNSVNLWDYSSQREKNWPQEVKDVLAARNFNDGTVPNRYPSPFVQHPTPQPRPQSHEEKLAALDAQNNAELARLAANQPPADNVFIHNPSMSDEENMRMGIMDAVMRGNPNIPKPTQKPASAPTPLPPTGSINVAQGYSGPKSPLNAYFSNVPNTPGGNSGNGLFGDVAGTPVTPSQTSLFMANRTAGLPSVGFGAPQAQSQPIQSAPQTATNTPARDAWSIPADIQNASYNARQALGTGNGSTPMPTAKPVSQPNYSGYGQQSSAENATAPQPRSSEPQFLTKTIAQQVPKSPAGGMSLDQATQFAYGSTAVVDSLRSAPIPTAKPAQEFETVTKQIQVQNPNYQPTPMAQPMAAPPIPKAKPQEQSFLGALGGMFNPAGTAGGLLGGALGGPLGSVAGNLAGRGISNVVRNSPTVGNRGTTNSFGTGNGSGGPYAGQSWRNTSTGGTRVFNPSTRQYEDIGGSNAGNRSSSQTTGSGGGFFSSLFG